MKNRNFKNCLITGITGSGGSYLAEHINNKNKKIKILGTTRKKVSDVNQTLKKISSISRLNLHWNFNLTKKIFE